MSTTRRPLAFARVNGDHRRLAQTGSVLGDSADLLIGELAGNHTHHLLCVVGPLVTPEVLQLSGRVLGVLSGQPRILHWQTGAGRAVTPGTRRNALLEIPLAPKRLAIRKQFSSLATEGCIFCCEKYTDRLRMSSSDSAATMPPMIALLRTAGLPSTALKLLNCL
jgi:hypothetical protein